MSDRSYDAELVRSALNKRKDGIKATQREAAALKAFEKEKLERDRVAVCSEIPKGVYCEWARRQPKVVNEQGDRYRLPIRGRTVNLIELVGAVHDFLAANAKKLSAGDLDDPLLAGATSPALELFRMERYKRERLTRLEQESMLLRLDDVRDRLVRVASIIRQAGELLEKQHGREAAAILEAALEDAQNEIDALGEGRCLYADDDSFDEGPPVRSDAESLS